MVAPNVSRMDAAIDARGGVLGYIRRPDRGEGAAPTRVLQPRRLLARLVSLEINLSLVLQPAQSLWAEIEVGRELLLRQPLGKIGVPA